MLGVMLMTVMGVVSAVSPPMIVNPLNGDDVGGDLVVEWTNDLNSAFLVMQYQEGTCSWALAQTSGWTDVPLTSSQRTLDIDTTTEFEDGPVCFRLVNPSFPPPLDFNTAWVDNTPPKAEFDVDGTLVVFETVTFDGSTSSDTGSGIDTYEWDFGDGETDTGVIVTHVYDEPGVYEVLLIVTDYAGNFAESDEDDVVIEDIETETETFEYETGILGITSALSETFDTGLTSVTCTVVPSSDNIANVAVGNSVDNCTLIETSDIPYSERGVHEIIIKATDGTTIKYYDVTITVYSWWIPLTEGWNLISIPMMPESTAINDVFGNIVENVAYEGSDYTIYQYDATNGKWYRAKKSSRSGSTYSGPSSYRLKTIVPGYGYWIKMKNADAILKGFGDMTPAIGGAMLGVEVANGWNLIGHYGLDNLSVYQALSSLRLGLLTRYYDSVVVSGNMETYHGYWMTAKFLPEGETLYTPSQQALNYIL